jgi:hypothetical protein
MKYLFFLLVVPVLCLLAKDRRTRAFEFEKLYATVNDCYNKDRCHQAIASSFLVEKGKPKDEYSPGKINDSSNQDWRETAWCVSKNQGVREYIYVPYQNRQSINKYKYKDIWERGGSDSLFIIINGVGKSKDLFLANNRVKRVSIEVQEIAYTMSVSGPDTIAGTDIHIDEGPLLNSIHEIELADTMEEQEFKLKIIPKSKKDPNLHMDLLFKITIKEIYPGSKHKNTCISEANFLMVPLNKK